MTVALRVFASALLVALGSTILAPPPAADAGQQRRQPSRRPSAAAALARVTERAAIVPRVDHHQHIVGPRAVIAPPPLLPEPEMSPELARVVRARNGLAEGAEVPAGLYADDARILDASAESQPWLRGPEAISRVAASYGSGARFVPQFVSAGETIAQITGVVVSGASPENRMSFVLGLVRDAGGSWRIASEQATPIPPPPFAVPITADDLIRDMDETGIQRAVLLSVAYFFASPSRTWPGDEYANVRAENDWVAAQAARYPDRLVAFCGVSPLEDYAVDEIRRCARNLRVRGVKIHFRSSRVDVLNPEHLEKVRRVFRTANELGLAVVVHTHTRVYGREHAEVFLRELLPAAPDVPVQIAHLWGGNEYAPDALAVFADAVAANDPRAKNLYFDLTEVEAAAGDSKETLEEIARTVRRIGLKRIFYGSDAAATPDAPPTSLRWARLRRKLPLTNAEWRVVAANVAPYMR